MGTEEHLTLSPMTTDETPIGLQHARRCPDCRRWRYRGWLPMVGYNPPRICVCGIPWLARAAQLGRFGLRAGFSDEGWRKRP